jgi:hypothetical protein
MPQKGRVIPLRPSAPALQAGGWLRDGAVPVAGADSFATFTSGQRKPRPGAGFERGKFSGAHRDTALMRERRGGILSPVATNCLPGTGLGN